MSPMKRIAEYGIPVHSYIAAIQYLSNTEDFTTSQYSQMIEKISGKQFSADPRTTKYSFLYLIQDTIKTSFTTDSFNMEKILHNASEKALTFIAENSWHWAEPEENIKVDGTGKQKRKKGAKQEQALHIYKDNISKGKKDVIELFMSELDMSKAGATTYFYNTRKKVG